MKAVIYHRYGTPGELTLQETATPAPNDNEILVQNRAVSINSWDYDLLTGIPLSYRLLSGIFKPSKKIIGCDIAGIVSGVGKNITQFKPGDEVLGDVSGYKWGGFAEYTLAQEKNLIKKPAGMTFTEAASLPQAAVLAFQALHDIRPVKPGDKILINGAGGGVGTFALQMAKALGAEVTCVDSAGKLQLLQALGADRVIDYRKENFTRSAGRYHLVIEVTMQQPVSRYMDVLLPGGSAAIIGGRVSYILQTAGTGWWLKRRHNKQCSILIHEPNKYMEKILGLWAKGIKPVIDSVFPLEKTREAFMHYASGQFMGKVVIEVNNG